jgi:Sigma-70 region 2/alpha/beta hydrolase fold
VREAAGHVAGLAESGPVLLLERIRFYGQYIVVDGRASAADELGIADPAGFEVAFRGRFAPVYRFICRRVGTPLAEDLAADVFATAYRRRTSFQPARGSLRSWLYGMAHRVGNREVACRPAGPSLKGCPGGGLPCHRPFQIRVSPHPLPANASHVAQADTLASLRDALGVPRAVVLAVSAGAQPATHFALRHPEQVQALVLITPALHLPPEPGVPSESGPPGFVLDYVLASDFMV